MTVGVIVHDLTQEERKAAYACDVTYGTNNEMGFDYLRDNMVIYQKNMVQRGHHFAIVGRGGLHPSDYLRRGRQIHRPV